MFKNLSFTSSLIKNPLSLLAALMASGVALGETATPLEATEQLPIKEVTIFKDGHTFVLHEGLMPVDAKGNVVMDYLPAPVLGTFWPYSHQKNAVLRSVTAGKKKVSTQKTALTMRELIEANIGAEVIVTEKPASPTAPTQPASFAATILEIPTRSGEELDALAPPSSVGKLPVKGSIVMLKTTEGVKALEIERILDVTFLNEKEDKVQNEEFRNRLTLDLKWKSKPLKKANVGMIYLQRGIRWIPSYKIDINDKGKAKLKLEATLINELANLNDVTAHLVIGVPSFAFKDQVDPMSLKKDVAKLTSHFQQNSQTAYGFSNAIDSQMMVPSRGRRSAPPANASSTMDLGPEISGTKKSEDLYMFTVEHISLKKGERMVIPITEYELDYTDVYALNIPFTPPTEALRKMNQNQRNDLSRAFHSPKVKHKIRIENKSNQPLTTAPAMILKDGRLVAQGMMTYTSVGANVDIELTTAVDITVKKSDIEIKRTPNAVKWDGSNYTRIDLEGAITLTNYKKKPTIVEITRYTLGNVDTVSQDGKKEMVNPFEDHSFLPKGPTGSWWQSYSWPWWWYRFNGIGRITWTTTLEPNKETEHQYKWHYFWR
jgi:hypothetical protein